VSPVSPHIDSGFRKPQVRAFKYSDTRELIFLITEACNLNCVYCYEKNKSGKRLSPDCIKDRILSAMLAQDGYQNLSVYFFGGEPLLAFDTIREVVEWFLSARWPTPRKGFRFWVSTNGTLLNDRMKHWFSANREYITLGLSLDGTKTAQDRNRCNSYDDVIKHIDFFRENWPEQPVKMTLGPQSIDELYDGVVQIHRFGLPVDADVVFEDVWGDEASEKIAVRKWSEQLAKLVEFYSMNPKLPRPKLLTRDLLHLFDDDSGGPYRFCGAGKHTVTITAEGIEVPCARFAPISLCQPVHHLGDTDAENERCSNCCFVKICPTCEAHNLMVTGSCFARTTFHCRFFLVSLLASARLMLLDHPEDLGVPSQAQSQEEQLKRLRRLLAVRAITDLCSPVIDWAFATAAISETLD